MLKSATLMPTLQRGAAVWASELYCKVLLRSDYSARQCFSSGSAPVSLGDLTLMTHSMVTRARGNAGKNGRGELVSPDGELSQIDDFIFPAFPLISPLFSLSLSLLILSLILSLSLTKPRNGTLATVLWGGFVGTLSPR